jgi:hypothetical protein
MHVLVQVACHDYSHQRMPCLLALFCACVPSGAHFVHGSLLPLGLVCPPPPPPTHTPPCWAISNEQDTMDKLAQLIRDIVSAAPWKSKVAASQKYGISALVAREKGEIARSRDAIREAFRGDLEELKANAKQMVALSEQFTAKLRKGEVDDADAAEFQQYVMSLGIADPVTKKACGGSQSKFHRELAAELGRVLAEPLAKNGGMMQLQDVYCLYNRARGTMLISPDDLVAAAVLFAEAGVPMTLRTFDSGVKVIQAATQGDEAIADKVRARVCPLHAATRCRQQLLCLRHARGVMIVGLSIASRTVNVSMLLMMNEQTKQHSRNDTPSCSDFM